MLNRTIVAAALFAITIPIAVNAQQTAPAAPSATAPATPSRQPTVAETEARAKFRAACSADIAKFCKDIPPAGQTTAATTPDQMKGQRANMRQCLATNAANLSADCKSAVDQRAARETAPKS